MAATTITKLKTFFNEKENLGTIVSKLEPFYSMSDSEVREDQINRYRSLIEDFHETYKHSQRSVRIFRAPGRIEIIGNHTDHNGGKVLAGAIDDDDIVAARFNGTREIRVKSRGYGDLVTIDLDNLPSADDAEDGNWVSFVKGVAKEFSERGRKVEGMDLYIDGRVDDGSGVSSSAALNMAVATTFNEMHNFKLDKVELSKICQNAEPYYGKRCGLMDPMASAFGGVITIDFKDLENPAYKQIEVDFAKSGYAAVVINPPGQGHGDLTDAYNGIRENMEAIAGKFGKDRLCEVPFEAYEKRRSEFLGDGALGEGAVMMADHYYKECERVDTVVDNLCLGGSQRFRHFVLPEIRASGESSRDNLKNYCPPNETTGPIKESVERAESFDDQGRIYSRVTGGGFLGGTLNFVPIEILDPFVKEMRKVYDSDEAVKVYQIRPGACEIRFMNSSK